MDMCIHIVQPNGYWYCWLTSIDSCVRCQACGNISFHTPPKIISSTSPPPFTLVLTPQNMFINNLPPTIMAYSHDDTTTIERWCSFKPGTNTRPPYRILALWRKLSPRFIIPITVYHHLSAQTHAQGAAAIFRQQLNYWTTILCNTIQILTQLESLFLK